MSPSQIAIERLHQSFSHVESRDRGTSLDHDLAMLMFSSATFGQENEDAVAVRLEFQPWGNDRPVESDDENLPEAVVYDAASNFDDDSNRTSAGNDKYPKASVSAEDRDLQMLIEASAGPNRGAVCREEEEGWAMKSLSETELAAAVENARREFSSGAEGEEGEEEEQQEQFHKSMPRLRHSLMVPLRHSLIRNRRLSNVMEEEVKDKNDEANRNSVRSEIRNKGSTHQQQNHEGENPLAKWALSVLTTRRMPPDEKKERPCEQNPKDCDQSEAEEQVNHARQLRRRSRDQGRSALKDVVKQKNLDNITSPRDPSPRRYQPGLKGTVSPVPTDLKKFTPSTPDTASTSCTMSPSPRHPRQQRMNSKEVQRLADMLDIDEEAELKRQQEAALIEIL